MATSEKNRQSVERLLKRTGEPVLNPLDYNASLIRALNWYSIEVENKVKKGWVLSLYKNELNGSISEINEREFKQVGTLIRLKNNGNALQEKEEQFIKSEISRLNKISLKPKVEKVVEEQPVTKKIIDHDGLCSDFMSEFNSLIDEYTIDRKNIPDIDYLIKKIPSNIVAKNIAALLLKPIEELNLVLSGTDKQLNEGYSNFKKPELKKLLSFYEQLLNGLEQTKKTQERKPRAKKEVPAIKLVEKMTYQNDDPNLGLKSVHPMHIVGSTEVWCYNVKYRRLQQYVSINGMTLTVKGSTILNFDIEKSIQKGVRKPEQLVALNGQGKRSYKKFLDSLTNKAGSLTGRINGDIIIMATFKGTS
jgi:hypothetical protein